MSWKRSLYNKIPIGWTERIGIDPEILYYRVRSDDTFPSEFVSGYSTFKRETSEDLPPIDAVKPYLEDQNAQAGTATGDYFHQDLWAAKKIYDAEPAEHYDIGSRVDGFISHCLVFRTITLIDIRPFEEKLEGLNFIQADGTTMAPIRSGSLESVSSLHAAEHFGLGRYGDPIDPKGHLKFMKSLERVLAPNGRLYFSVPVGRERVEFNAHRVLSPHTVLNSFSDLELISKDAVIEGKLHKDVDIDLLESQEWACGLFEFEKRDS
jgi:SAM-dependent methyltransferase